MKPIGIIRTNFQDRDSAPFQGLGDALHPGSLEVFAEFVEGMRSIEEGRWGMILFHFHRSTGYKLTTTSKSSGCTLGVFSTRSPNRPNGIGISVVRFTRIDGHRFDFLGADMLDGTPLLDVKPYDPGLYPR